MDALVWRVEFISIGKLKRERMTEENMDGRNKKDKDAKGLNEVMLDRNGLRRMIHVLHPA